MNRRTGGFSLIEILIVLAISAVMVVAVWSVVSNVVKSDDDSRIRLELQLQATSALRKISDLLKMAGPTGTVSLGLGPNDYPVFALDTTGGGFTGANTFLNLTTWQTPPVSGPNTVLNDAVAHLAPATDTDGYYGISNEIAFKLPRPAPWFTPGTLPAGTSDNPIDSSGAPVDSTGLVTWGISSNLYQYYLGVYNGYVSSGYAPVASPGTALADRQTDIYAIVLVPTTSFQKDSGGNPVAGPNQLELREYSSQYSAARYLIRKTILATNVERILFTAPKSSNYYLTGNNPATGLPFQDQTGTLGLNQLGVTIWMWRNDINKNRYAISASRTTQSITVNLRSVGENQLAN